jgi:phage/plasmid-like protein (TIGR03299 family)
MRTNPMDAIGDDVSGHLRAKEAFEQAQLNNWRVRLASLLAYDDDGVGKDGIGFPDLYDAIDVPENFATVFDNPWSGKVETLGVVGTKYRPLQNEELHSLIDMARDSTKSTFYRAGWLPKLKRVFVALKLDSTEFVGGKDPIDFYILGKTSHDGSFTFRFELFAVRLACQNMLTVNLPQLQFDYRAKHTSNAQQKIATLEKYLQSIESLISAFMNSANRMFGTQMSDGDAAKVFEILQELTPNTPAKRRRQIEKQRGQFLAILRSREMADIHGSVWGAFQAHLEWYQYEAPVRSGRNSESYVRASRAVFPSAQYTKYVDSAFREYSKFLTVE